MKVGIIYIENQYKDVFDLIFVNIIFIMKLKGQIWCQATRMDSQKIKFYSQQKQKHYVSDNKQKLDRKSTKAMSERSGNFDCFGLNQTFEECPQPPSPVSSSDGASSAEVKYLSYLVQVIDSAPVGSDKQQIDMHYQTAEYWHMVYQSAIYVKKDVYRTQIDDNLIMSEILGYLIPGRIHPQHANQIGQELLKNGYFLCAYAISTARKRKSAFIFRYLMQYFQKEYHLETNQQQFFYLIENYVYSDQVQEILHLNLDVPFTQSNNKKYLTPGNDQTQQNYPQQFLSPNRISYQTYLEQESQKSRTILIEDESQFSINS